MLKERMRKRWDEWKWGLLWMVFIIVTAAIILPIIGVGQSGKDNVTRPKREVKTDFCLKRYGGIELNYTQGSTTSFTFDLCNVINCGGKNSSHRGYDVYLCNDAMVQMQCEVSGKADNKWCGPYWGDIVKYTGIWEPYQNQHWEEVDLQRDYSLGQNPLTLSITNWNNYPLKNRIKHQNKTVYVVLGVDVTGTDPMGVIKINVIKPEKTVQNSSQVKDNGKKDERPREIIEVDYTKLKPEDIIEKATGYGDNNLWLEWVITTARENGLEDCIGCANARPRLYTEPAPLFPDDQWGYNCMLALTRQSTPSNCSTLAAIFPPLNNNSKAGPFTPIKANYSCFNFSGENKSLGEIDLDWCNTTTLDNGTLIGPWARAGLYYYCGGRRLITRITKGTGGVCAMVRLGAPITLIGEKMKVTGQTSASSLTKRRRRHILSKRSTSSIDMSLNSPTYIDAIGVPRGVPNEYKLADQISAGMENIPLISALFPITPNKNVDRINYVHYNVMRLANMTRDAVDGLAEQLAPTSLMVVQNRMALDMLLAEKGGVCHMFGDLCCTYVPNNTAPDGSVTRALEGLKTLAVEMKEHSGVDNPWEEWMAKYLGKWKGVIMSVLLSIAVFIAVLVTCGCCCIPCIRSLCNRLIVTAIENKDGKPPSYAMPLLSNNDQTDEENDEF